MRFNTVRTRLPKPEKLIANFVGSDPVRQQLNFARLFKDGNDEWLEATDAHILIKTRNHHSFGLGNIPDGNDEWFVDPKGKIPASTQPYSYNDKNERVVHKYPDVGAVIPRWDDLKHVDISLNEVYWAAIAAEALSKKTDMPCAGITVLLPTHEMIHLAGPLLIHVFDMLQNLQPDGKVQMGYSSPNRAVIFRWDDESTILLMPVQKIEYQPFPILLNLANNRLHTLQNVEEIYFGDLEMGAIRRENPQPQVNHEEPAKVEPEETPAEDKKEDETPIEKKEFDDFSWLDDAIVEKTTTYPATATDDDDDDDDDGDIPEPATATDDDDEIGDWKTILASMN